MVKGTVDDRSRLNDEMAELCAKLPIYLVVKVDKAPTDMDQPMDQAPAKRKWNTCDIEYDNLYGTYKLSILFIKRISWQD